MIVAIVPLKDLRTYRATTRKPSASADGGCHFLNCRIIDRNTFSVGVRFNESSCSSVMSGQMKQSVVRVMTVSRMPTIYSISAKCFASLRAIARDFIWQPVRRISGCFISYPTGGQGRARRARAKLGLLPSFPHLCNKLLISHMLFMSLDFQHHFCGVEFFRRQIPCALAQFVYPRLRQFNL